MTMQTVREILQAVAVHLGYTVASVAVGFVLGVALGIVLSRFPRAARFILPTLSVLNTVPGIVFIGLLFLWLGMRPITVLAALSIYAAFPVLKNTVAMACSARRTPPTSRRRRPSWKLTTEKCGRLFSLCGGKTQNVWDTTKPLRGGICRSRRAPLLRKPCVFRQMTSAGTRRTTTRGITPMST